MLVWFQANVKVNVKSPGCIYIALATDFSFNCSPNWTNIAACDLIFWFWFFAFLSYRSFMIGIFFLNDRIAVFKDCIYISNPGFQIDLKFRCCCFREKFVSDTICWKSVCWFLWSNNWKQLSFIKYCFYIYFPDF